MTTRARFAWLLALGALVVGLCAGAPVVKAQEAATGEAGNDDTAAAAAESRPELLDPREAELDAQAAEVAAQLRCPVCRNQSILESNAELSREMQAVVRERLAAGESPEQVRAYFVGRYGEWILLRPTARGINLLVYVLPLLALVIGALILRGRLRKWAVSAGGGPAEAATAPGELSAENERWLQEVLREG